MLKHIQRAFLENPGFLWGHTALFLLGMLLLASGFPVLTAIGPSVAAVGIVGYVSYLSVKNEDSIGRQGRVLVSDYGFRAAFSRRGAAIPEEYNKRLAGVRDAIDVLGFGLAALRQDYGPEFDEWAKHAVVRVLLIDPDYPNGGSSYARQRDLEERSSPGQISSDVEAFLRDTSDLRSANKGFQVRLMRCLPSVNIFRVDDDIFWGPYLMGGPSRNLPTFVVAEPGRMYKTLRAHFDAIWDSSDFSAPAPR